MPLSLTAIGDRVMIRKSGHPNRVNNLLKSSGIIGGGRRRRRRRREDEEKDTR